MTLPPILDIRDDLYRAFEATGEDEALGEEIETVLDRLDAFEDRDAASRTGVIDEIDNQLLRVEERLDDESASRAIQAARNRIHIYRESREATAEDLVVVESTVEEREDADADGLLPVGEVTVALTVANAGDDAEEVVPVVTLYDEGGDEVEAVRGPAFELLDGEQDYIEMVVDVPADASYYAASVVGAGARDRSA